MKIMINKEQYAFWAEADCGNFRSLLRDMGYCSVAQSGSMWELVEASGSCGSCWEAVEDMWKTWKGLEGVEDMWETWEGSEGGVGGLGEVREVQKRSCDDAN